MKKITGYMGRAFLLLTLLAAAFIATEASAGGGFGRIDGARLQALVNDGTGTVIVDVREPRLYARGHIPGAINIPYDGAHERVLTELSPKDRIVFVCHGGPMGDELAGLLVENGYERVYNLIGGMRGWNGALEK